MLVQEYPVTTPYGDVPGYPLHNGFHQGIDYGCPVGTPVIVNGTIIGISGNTGYTFGPHLHLGKWLGGAVQNPLNDGFQFNSAVVTQVGEDADDGKFVRVQGDGFSWVYLHLSNNSIVKVGQVLQGEIAMGVTIEGIPASVSWGEDRIDVFAKGTDGGLWHKFFDQNGWSKDWEKLPGGVKELGSVSSWAVGRLDIFGTGEGEGGAGVLYHWWLQPDGKWGLENLGVIK